MSRFIHELEDWPRLSWNQERIAPLLSTVRIRQGRLLGRMESVGFNLQEEAVLQTLTQDVVESSSIEGEILDKAQVRSSLARRLGMDVGALIPADRTVEGIVEMMLDATQLYGEPLTEERLFRWQAALFPTGRSGLTRLRIGAWRDDANGPMEVVSGPIGKESVHFEAPAAVRLPSEMVAFLDWFNGEASPLDPVVKAGLAHLWFVTIHPFDDGNGRIARAIADLALARSEGTEQRFYSLSAQIRRERKAYYDVLEATQRGGLDATDWLAWFLGGLDRALIGAEETLGTVLEKARFWEKHGSANLNERQRLMLNRLLDGFTGKMTTSKWATIAKCSQDTALRDIQDLIERRILQRDIAGGRSTGYSFRVPEG
jgi:Fic family protein